MKRRLVKLVVFLLLGAIVNIAVAWAAATLNYPYSRSEAFGIFGNWFIISDADAMSTRIGCTGNTSGKSEIPAEAHVRPASTPPWLRGLLSIPRITTDDSGHTHFAVMRLVHADGWPCLSLWGAQTECFKSRERPQVGVEEQHMHWALGKIRDATPQDEGSVILLPLRPIWPGFAINTLFYAAILWLLFAAPFALRRRIRIKRGLCPKCAYPVGENSICTECGKPVSPHP